MSFEKSYLEQAQRVVTDVLDEVRPDLMAAYGSIRHDVKPDNTIVTEFDHMIEDKLHEALGQFDSSIGFHGEENGGQMDEGGSFWLVDPIDGTEHFARGLPFCGSMATFIHDGMPHVSVIDLFALGERLTAIKGLGAFCNGNPIHVSDVPMSRAIVELETRTNDEKNLDKWKAVRDEIYGYFNFLSSCYGFSRVAMGKMEGRIALNGYGYAWDFAPGALLVSEAGGRVANVGSDSYDYRNLNVIASSPSVHGRLQELLRD